MTGRSVYLVQRVIGFLLLIAAIASVAQSYRVTSDFRGYVRCQAAVNDAVIRSLVVRGGAADDERQAERRADDAFNAALNVLLANPPRPVEERRDALEKLNRALAEQHREREEADRARTTNPLPAPPSQTCD